MSNIWNRAGHTDIQLVGPVIYPKFIFPLYIDYFVSRDPVPSESIENTFSESIRKIVSYGTIGHDKNKVDYLECIAKPNRQRQWITKYTNY